MRTADLIPGTLVVVRRPGRHDRPAVVQDVITRNGRTLAGVRFTDTVPGLTGPDVRNYYAATIAPRYLYPLEVTP